MRQIRTTRAFGAAVRQARAERGLSQAELATLAGVSRPWLSELESGKRSVELGRALTVLATLDLALDIVPTTDPDEAGIDLGRLVDGDM